MPRRLPSTKSPCGLEYARCTLEELRRFISDRTGEAPRSTSSMTRLIITLAALDEDSGAFDFLNLPQEMIRDIIYCELLTEYPTASGVNGCSTAPLRASKQIHREAEAILYSQNPATVNLHPDIDYGRRPPRVAWTLDCDLPRTRYKQRTMLTSNDVLPKELSSQLRKFKILNIKLTFTILSRGIEPPRGISVKERAVKLINTKLFNLAEFLASGYSLKRLNFEMISQPGNISTDHKHLSIYAWGRS